MKLFSFHGSHHDVGKAIGETFGEQIHKALAGNVALRERYLPFHRTDERGKKYEELLQIHVSRFPDYVSELEGISEGAGVPFEELFVANLWEVYEGFAPQPETSGCSTCSLLTADRALFGHNEDNQPFYSEQMYLVHIEIPAKPTFVALCYPGYLPGRAFGFNSEGICFCANSVMVKEPVIGVGRHFISRSIFEARSLEDAVDLAVVPGRASGFSYGIGSTKERRIVDLEVSPDGYHFTEVEGVFFRANQYLKLNRADQSIAPSSRARQKRGEELLAQGEIRSETDVLKVLRDQQVQDYPIFRNGTPPDKGITLVTAVFDLDSEKLTIYPGALEEKGVGFEPLIEIPIT